MSRPTAARPPRLPAHRLLPLPSLLLFGRTSFFSFSMAFALLIFAQYFSTATSNASRLRFSFGTESKISCIPFLQTATAQAHTPA